MVRSNSIARCSYTIQDDEDSEKSRLSIPSQFFLWIHLFSFEIREEREAVFKLNFFASLFLFFSSSFPFFLIFFPIISHSLFFFFPFFWIQTNLKVYVREADERDPRFDQLHYRFAVPENKAGILVGRVELKPRKFRVNSQMVYSIVNTEMRSLFNITSVSYYPHPHQFCSTYAPHLSC